MNHPIRLGVIGLQFAAKVHVPAFRANSGCTVVAVAGRDAQKAEAVAKELNIPISLPDWRELVASPDIDAVSIAVPPAAQAEIVEEAARQGKHIFCEKPLAASVSEAEQMLHSVETSGVVHAVDFLFPEIPAWRRAREVLSAGEIGPLRHFSYTWKVETYASRHDLDNWKNRAAEGGGVFGNFFSHVFYNIEWLMGTISQIEGSALLRGASDNCAAECRVGLADGSSGTIMVRTDAFLGCGHLIELHGENGTLILHNPTPDYAAGFQLKLGTRKKPALVPVEMQAAPEAGDGRIAAVQSIARRFLNAVREGGEVKPNFGDGLKVQTLLKQADMIATAPWRTAP